MSLFEVAMLTLVGIAAGTMNTIVGSGSLVTFPALLAFGYTPFVANITNNVGVIPGAISGAYAFRSELRTQWPRVIRLSAIALTGGIAGSLLFLALPSKAFNAIVPVLIGLSLVLVIIQPWLKKRAARRGGVTPRQAFFHRVALFLTGVYGGYFGAAQGVLLMSLLGAMFDETIQRLNSMKIILALWANTAAAIVFIVHGGIVWEAAGAIGVGALIGGQVGGHIGRRLPEPVYRGAIVAVGIAAIVKLLSS